jgi:hypothetical protein
VATTVPEAPPDATRPRAPRTAVGIRTSPERLAAYAAAALIVFYLVLSAIMLEKPGLQHDEIFQVNAALGNLDGEFDDYQWSLFGLHLPIQLAPYSGAPKAWILAPLLAVFPMTPETLRWPGIVLGAIALAFCYAAFRRMFGIRAALIAVALLATDPFYVFEVRNDHGPVALADACKAAALFFLIRFWRERRPLDGFWAFLIVGLGIWDKANFGWFLLALPVAMVAAFGIRGFRRLSRAQYLACAAGLLLGGLPFIAYNVVTLGGTFADQLGTAGSLLDLIREKLFVIIPGSLNAAAPYVLFDGFGPRPPLLTVTVQLTLCALVLFAFLTLAARRPPRALTFLLAIVVVIAAFIIVLRHATGPHHVAFLLPLLQGFVAGTLVLFADRIAGWFGAGSLVHRIASGAVGAAVLVAIGFNLAVDREYYQYLGRYGGAGVWSDQIYPLVDYLQHEKVGKVAVMDWGFETQINALSYNHVPRLLLNFMNGDPEKTAAQLEPYRDQVQTWLFHSPRYAVFSEPRVAFDIMAHRDRLRVVHVRDFRQGDGQVVYELLRLVPPRTAARAAAAPAAAAPRRLRRPALPPLPGGASVDFVRAFRAGVINRDDPAETPNGKGALLADWPAPRGRYRALTVLGQYAYTFPAVRVSRDSVLEFDVAKVYSLGIGAQAWVDVGGEDEPRRVFTATIPAARDGDVPAWRHVSIRLDAGDVVTSLTFGATSLPGDGLADWIAFAHPVLRHAKLAR